MRTILTRLTAAVVTTAAVGLAMQVGAAPARAEACATSTGVTVVVDFHELGGGVQSVCRSDGGGQYADDLFPAAGFQLREATRQPGFVCRVNNLPSTDPCVNTAPETAYWALWWSTGEPGASWTYSSLGVGSLQLPKGSLVAFSWDQVSGDQPPGASPERPTAPSTAPPSTTSPPSQPSKSAPPAHHGPTKPPSQPGQSAPPSPDQPSTSAPSESSTDEATDEATPEVPSESPTATDSATATDAPSTTPAAPESVVPSDVADPADPGPTSTSTVEPVDDGKLPVWVVPVVLVLLTGSAFGTELLRRRRKQG